jgi:hypothetical protein
MTAGISTVERISPDALQPLFKKIRQTQRGNPTPIQTNTRGLAIKVVRVFRLQLQSLGQRIHQTVLSGNSVITKIRQSGLNVHSAGYSPFFLVAPIEIQVIAGSKNARIYHAVNRPFVLQHDRGAAVQTAFFVHQDAYPGTRAHQLAECNAQRGVVLNLQKSFPAYRWVYFYGTPKVCHLVVGVHLGGTAGIASV